MNAQLYREVIVSYDIANSRNRTKLFNALKDAGLTPIQKSIFWGHVRKVEIRAIVRLLKEHCKDNDKGFIARINLAAQIESQSSGYQNQDFTSRPVAYHVI